MKTLMTRILMIGGLAGLVLGLSSCSEKTTEDRARDALERVDDAGKEIGDGFEDAADELD